MRRASVNFVVDALAFAGFVFLTATGVMVRYVLPPFSGHFSTLWGMDRHEWGDVHFWVAVVVLGTLGLHLALHWRWVVSVVKGRPRQGSGARAGLGAVALLGLAGLAMAPLFAPVEQTGEPPHRSRGHGQDDSEVPRIDGSMTLEELEELTGVPVELVIRELGLPADVRPDERLGRLRRTCGFEMNEVRELVDRQRREQ